MGRSDSAITRREILKRGAVVGGGVLWITPVVQTLGMGSAYAKPVSGDPCRMNLTIRDCAPLSGGSGVFVDMKVCFSFDCPCISAPGNGHHVMLAVDGTYVVEMGVITSVSECYVGGTELAGLTKSVFFQAHCVKGSGDTAQIVAMSNMVEFAPKDYSVCLNST